MSIFDEVSVQMKEALRAKQAVRLAALRSMRAGFLNEMKKDGAERLDDEDYRAIGFHDAVRVGHLSLDAVRRIGDPDLLFYNVNSPDDLAHAEELWRQHVSSQ